MGFVTATDIAIQRRELVKITTGCKEVDAILEGASHPGDCILRLTDAGAVCVWCNVCVTREASVFIVETLLWLYGRRHGERRHHRDVWGVPHGEDADVPHPRSHMPGGFVDIDQAIPEVVVC